MKYLKKFNESQNFEEIYDEEIKFIENSLIDLDDEFDIVYKEIAPNAWEKTENCFYSYKWMDFHDVFYCDISIRINYNFEYTNYSALKKIIESKYPGILKKVEEIEKECTDFISKNDNEVKFRKDFTSYNEDIILIKLSFRIKRNDWVEKDNSVKSMLKRVGGWSDEDLRKFKELGYDISERFKYKNITPEEIRETIKKGGYIYATIVKGFPNNDKNEPLKPVDIDSDGLITVEFRGQIYEVDIEDVDKVDVSTNENTSYEDRKDFSEMKYIDIASYFTGLKRQLKFAFYTWDIVSYLWRSSRDPKIMQKIYKRLEEMEDYLISTIDKYKEIETKIEDINDRSASSGEFEYDLYCIKPYGEWNEIADDKGSIFIQNQTEIKTQIRRWDAQFCIYIDISKDIEGRSVYKKSHYEKIISLSEILKWLKRDFHEIEVFTGRIEGKDKIMVSFSCK